MQFDLFKYPHRPGHRKTDTSKEAADDLAPEAGNIRERVYQAILDADKYGLTTEEICQRTDIRYATAQPRTSELQELGQIRDSGFRRKNASGKNAIVWVAC